MESANSLELSLKDEELQGDIWLGSVQQTMQKQSFNK